MVFRQAAEAWGRLSETLNRLDKCLTMYLEDVDVKLKPCPFCGEDLVLIDNKWRHDGNSNCIADNITFGRWEFYMHDKWNERKW